MLGRQGSCYLKKFFFSHGLSYYSRSPVSAREESGNKERGGEERERGPETGSVYRPISGGAGRGNRTARLLFTFFFTQEGTVEEPRNNNCYI